ncbi:MAG: hypothetical protein M3O30_07970 [Planctomycetota bacterium]|nr:hypothetical protein [Planctomycetota bacterium]
MPQTQVLGLHAFPFLIFSNGSQKYKRLLALEPMPPRNIENSENAAVLKMPARMTDKRFTLFDAITIAQNRLIPWIEGFEEK